MLQAPFEKEKVRNLVVIDLDCLSRSFDWTFQRTSKHDINLRFWRPKNPVPWKNVAAGEFFLQLFRPD